MDVYKLMRDFWDWAFENPEKVKPNHACIYFFAIQHCNRLGWKKKFGLPSTMVMEATGIKSYKTYISSFKELVEFGFIELIEKSKNQYSSNVIALSNFTKAHTKALDKATTKHMSKQRQSTHQSIDSIIIPIYNNTNLPIYNNIDSRKLKFSATIKKFIPIYPEKMLDDFFSYWTEPNKSNTKFRQEMEKTWNLERRLRTWANNDKMFKNNGNNQQHNTTRKPTADEARIAHIKQFEADIRKSAENDRGAGS